DALLTLARFLLYIKTCLVPRHPSPRPSGARCESWAKTSAMHAGGGASPPQSWLAVRSSAGQRLPRSNEGIPPCRSERMPRFCLHLAWLIVSRALRTPTLILLA